MKRIPQEVLDGAAIALYIAAALLLLAKYLRDADVPAEQEAK